MTPETRPIQGFPGYTITTDGQVYSTRYSQDGFPKPIKTRSTGNVLLCRGPYDRKQLQVKLLVKQTWGIDL